MSKLAKENQILVVRKEPGKAAEVEPLFENTLEAFQEAVGGYIETVTFSQDLILICNEEGRIMGLPHNCTIGEIDFCGTILAVGSSGEEFASLKAVLIPKVMGMLK